MEAAERWRVVDTGLRDPGQHAALDRALLEARESDEIPGTLRFFRHTPCILVGPYDPLLDEGACASRGLAVHRRLTDGSTIVCDGHHLGWSLYLGQREFGRVGAREVLKRLSHAAAAGLSALGVDAVYRARSEIVVDERTVAQAGLLRADRTLLYQAVLCLDADPAGRAPLFKAPWNEEERSVLLPDRYTSLCRALGGKVDMAAVKSNLIEAYESEFGVELRDADLTLSEQARYEAAVREQSPGAHYEIAPRPVVRVANATVVRGPLQLSACAMIEEERLVRQVWFKGCPLRPSTAIAGLEAALRDAPLERIENRVRAYFASRPVASEGGTPEDFVAVVRRAAAPHLLAG